MELRKIEEYKSSIWTGGKTTELFIFPENASYQSRNFDLRISTASIDLDFSEFTSLPGFNRKLMVLEGSIRIVHKDKYEKELARFDQDEFSGDWSTVSYGKAVDFNIMCSKRYFSELQSFRINKSQSFLFPILSTFEFVFIYLINGDLDLKNDGTNYNLKEKESILLNEISQNSEILFSSKTNAEYLVATILSR